MTNSDIRYHAILFGETVKVSPESMDSRNVPEWGEATRADADRIAMALLPGHRLAVVEAISIRTYSVPNFVEAPAPSSTSSLPPPCRGL